MEQWLRTFEFLEFQEVGVGGPQNTPATGQPTISGTAEVGETLTADTSGISDEDGLNTRHTATSGSGAATVRTPTSRTPLPRPTT